VKCGAGGGEPDINWTDRVRNEVLQRVKEERNILQTTKTSRANWIGDILCRSCLLTHVTKGKTEGRMTGSQRRRRKNLQDDPKKKRVYWKLKAEALDRTVWRTLSERDYGPVVRSTE